MFKNIDYKKYKTSFSYKYFWRILFLFAITYFFYAIFKEQINERVVDKILNKFPRSYWSDFFCLLLFIFIVINGRKNLIRYKLLPTINSSIFILSVIVFYFLFIRYNPSYYFYKLQTPFLKWISYSDVLLFFTCLLILNLRS